jgi:hypothetical protein
MFFCAKDNSCVVWRFAAKDREVSLILTTNN